MKKNVSFRSAAIMVLVLCSSAMLPAQNTAPNWSLAGNSNATNTSKLGTTNAINLRIFTNNAERIRVSTAGLVGINTTAPGARFHVNSAAGEKPIIAAVNGTTRFLVNSNGGTTIGAAALPPSNGLFVSGNTGLGTNAPSRKLHVVGTSLFTANLNVSEGGLNATNSAGDAISAIGSGNGVYAYGNRYGIQAIGSGTTAYGVFGDGFVGVYASSNIVSGDAVRAYAYNTTEYGVNAYSAQSFGVYGSTGNAGSYAGYFAGNVYSTGVYLGSDKALKKDVADVSSAMEIINKLQPKLYTFRQDGNYKLMNLPIGKHYGFIAQEVELVLPELVKATSFEPGKAAPPYGQAQDATGAKNVGQQGAESIAFKALNYTELIPIAIKGLQELSAENEQLKEENKSIKEELADLRQMVMDIKNMRNGSTTVTSAFLEQNYPNPVAGNTIIPYQVPVAVTSAHITITDAKGQAIKTITITKKGAGQVTFSPAALSAGTYHYTLWVEGKQADTRRLIIAR